MINSKLNSPKNLSQHFVFQSCPYAHLMFFGHVHYPQPLKQQRMIDLLQIFAHQKKVFH